MRQVWGEEREITKAEFDGIEQYRIRDIEVLKDAVAKERYGEKAANGVIVITMKRPQELDNLVISLIEQSPKWEPATAKGKPVSLCLTIPVTFQMRQEYLLISFS